MTIFQMKCYLTFSELLNFTRAAEVLHMTQPTLSKMIAGLEDEVGVPLVQRTKRSVILTNAGQVLCTYFRKMLADYKEGLERVSAASQGHCGSVRIGFSSAIISHVLPPLTKQMAAEHPDIDVILYDATQTELLQLLHNDELDLVFVDAFAPATYEELCTKVIYTDELGVIVSMAHPLAQKEAATLDELRNEKLLISGRLMQSASSPSTTNSIITSTLYENGLLPSVTQVTRTLSNMIVMVDCNAGVAVLPRRLAAYAPSTVRFCPIDKSRKDTASKLEVKIFAAWKERRDNACIRTVIQMLNDILPPEEAMQNPDSQLA